MNDNNNNDHKQSDNNDKKNKNGNNSGSNINFPNNNQNSNENLNWKGKEKDMMLRLHKIAQRCFDNDERVQVDCCKRLRQWLSIGKNAPIDEVVNTGVVPRLIQFLVNDNNPKLQFEAARILAHVVSSNTENTSVVVKHKGVSHFVNLLLSNNVDVAQEAVWALGNIAVESAQYRDNVLASGGLINLTKFQHRCFDRLNTAAMQNGWRFEQLLQNPRTLNLLEILRSVTWALSCFCRKPNQI